MMQLSAEKKDGLPLVQKEARWSATDKFSARRSTATLIAVRTLGICLVCLPLMKACHSLTMLRTGGYLLGAVLTVKYAFDVHLDEKFDCMVDIGWITGHSYIVYGPLANGVTMTVFELTPVYPTPSRYWQTVQRHQITLT
jgi:hypothetical protein